MPTFRGPGGLWNDHRPEELATPEAFARDPRLVWEWYGWRRDLVSECRPNPAHRAMAELVRARHSCVVTQNVDGLHERATEELPELSSSEDAFVSAGVRDSNGGPIELHGSLFRVRCTVCHARTPHREPVDASSDGALPACGACGGLLRPDVVWFGEPLDAAVIDSAFQAAQAADVCVVVGTSALVQPAASLPIATKRAGGGDAGQRSRRRARCSPPNRERREIRVRPRLRASQTSAYGVGRLKSCLGSSSGPAFP